MPKSQLASTFKTAARAFTSKSNAQRSPVSTLAKATRLSWIPAVAKRPASWSCKKCNNEKRRDDQLHEPTLAKTGWESFLSHDGTKCGGHCKTCAYWKTIWPDETRADNLKVARRKILGFRARYKRSIELNHKAHHSLRQELDKIYRECQSFATDRIQKAVKAVSHVDARR